MDLFIHMMYNKQINIKEEKAMLKKKKLFSTWFISITIIIGTVISVYATDTTMIQIWVNLAPINIFINGEKIIPPIDMKPMVYNDRAYISLRFINESLGNTVVWDEDTRSIFIDTEKDLRNDFNFIYTHYNLRNLSWKFAVACFKNDKKTMRNLAVKDLKIQNHSYSFENLEFLDVKNISPNQEGSTVYYVSCEFSENSEDSLTYLTVSITNVNEEWKVDSYWFEK